MRQSKPPKKFIGIESRCKKMKFLSARIKIEIDVQIVNLYISGIFSKIALLFRKKLDIIVIFLATYLNSYF